MRKVLISIAAVASAVAFASPAAAQYYPQPNSYGYGNPYNAGYNNDYGRVRNIDMRIQRMRSDIQMYHSQGRLSRNEAINLDRRAMQLQQRLSWTARNGINSRENRSFDHELDRLRASLRAEMRDGRRYANRGNYRGY